MYVDDLDRWGSRRSSGASFGRGWHASGLDEQLYDLPHYTDKHYRTARTIYGCEHEGLDYAYSDRIWQWDWNLAEEAAKLATASGAKVHTARWYQIFLNAFYHQGPPIELVHILAGWNVATGYPYQVFGWRKGA